MKYLAYFTVTLLFFGMGAYVWKVKHTGHRSAQSGEQSEYASFSGRGTLVLVGDVPVTIEDIDFEYQLQTLGLKKKDELTSIPDLGNRLERELSPLKQKLAGQIIERKMLFKFIEQDKRFFSTDPARYQGCIKEWQDSLQSMADFLTDDVLKEKFKKILCERSMVEQFANEVLFNKIQISDAQVLEYFKNHSKELREPERVVIRQIVLANEHDANKLKPLVNRENFAQLAATHSIAPEKDNGGLLGPFAKADMPQVFEIAFSMHPGEIRGILKSVYGFHIIMLERKLLRSDFSLKDATPKIRAILMKKRREEEYQKWVEQALNAISVVTPQPLW